MVKNLNKIQTLSCPIKEFFTDQTIVKVFGKFWETYFVQASQLIYLISIVQIVFFSTCCVYYLIIFKYSNVSVTTRRLQFRVFIGVVIQSLLPVVLTHIPLMIIMGSNERKEYDQMNNNLYILSAIIHNGVASLSILLVHGSYRKFLISFFWKEKSKVIQITHCSKTINLWTIITIVKCFRFFTAKLYNIIETHTLSISKFFLIR